MSCLPPSLPSVGSSWACCGRRRSYCGFLRRPHLFFSCTGPGSLSLMCSDGALCSVRHQSCCEFEMGSKPSKLQLKNIIHYSCLNLPLSLLLQPSLCWTEDKVWIGFLFRNHLVVISIHAGHFWTSSSGYLVLGRAEENFVSCLWGKCGMTYIR